MKMHSNKYHSRISFSGHCGWKVSLLMQKTFWRLISISMRFVFLQLCVLLLIASCSVEGLGLFCWFFFSRSFMPVGFFVSCFSLPLSWAEFFFFAQISYFHITLEPQGSWAAKNPQNWPTKVQKFIKHLILGFFLMLIDVLACVNFLSDTKLDNF